MPVERIKLPRRIQCTCGGTMIIDWNPNSQATQSVLAVCSPIASDFSSCGRAFGMSQDQARNMIADGQPPNPAPDARRSLRI